MKEKIELYFTVFIIRFVIQVTVTVFKIKENNATQFELK